jgi:glycolate oxidase iron-sulfur subunit
MKTDLADFIKDTPEGREADAILRKCVHCGFCTATCPTYQLLGDELDGPRGRIYLMKQALEGKPVTAITQLHLDRCLTCRSCETTCPSGVEYGRLLDIGRGLVAERVSRPAVVTLERRLLRTLITSPALFRSFLGIGRLVRPLLPAVLRAKVPEKMARPGPRPQPAHARRMLVLEGCVQPYLSPATNAAAARVFDRLGIALEAAPAAGCCGAVSYHLDAQSEGLDFMRRNIDAWWPYVERGCEAVVVTASGCGTTVKEYGHLLARDPAYAAKAARISDLAKDISEVVVAERAKLLALLPAPASRLPVKRVAYHPPCSLQHGQKLRGQVESLLIAFGVDLVPVADAHLCCGSAGTYSILHPEISTRLLKNKVAALSRGEPAEIVTANIGCQSHIRSGTSLPVRHWIELVDELLPADATKPL